jgi:hypothetical protein
LNGRRHSDFASSAKYVVFYEKNTADTFNFLRMLGKIEQKDEKWAISDQFLATIQFSNTIFIFVLRIPLKPEFYHQGGRFQGFFWRIWAEIFFFQKKIFFAAVSA